MKKFTIIGSLIFLVGILIFTAALAMAGWDITKISTRPHADEVTVDFENQNQAITVTDEDVPLTLGKSNDDKIHISYFENKLESYRVDNSADHLEIEKTTDYHWYHYIFNIDFQKKHLEVLLPEEYCGVLTLQTSNGRITLDDFTASALHVEGDNGAVTLGNIHCLGSVSVKTENGKIEASNVNVSEDLEIEGNNGSIKLRAVQAKNLHASTENGSISATDVAGEESVTLTNSNARIKTDRLSAGKSITLSTDNGSVSGSIIGKQSDFSITARAYNGSSNLPEITSGGEKTLSVATGNGSINIEFVE